MAFSSKKENDYYSQLEQIAGEVDSYIVKTDGSLEYFREQIRPLTQRWKTYYEAVDKRKKELLDHWEKVKKNPKLQDKNIKPSEELEWDSFYLWNLPIGPDDKIQNPKYYMPAKLTSIYLKNLKGFIDRNKEKLKTLLFSSSECKRLQGTIADQEHQYNEIETRYNKLTDEQQENDRFFVEGMWYRCVYSLEEESEKVFGCWRPPLIPLPEYPLNILKPVESEYHINQTRKELPDARNAQDEYERYYIFLSSVHDNFLQGVEKITEGIWLYNLSIAVLCCLNKGHGDKTAFLKAALGRVCQSNHKTDKMKEQEKPEGSILMMSSRSSKENWESIRSEYGISKRDFGKKINFVSDAFKRKVIFRDVEHAFVLASEGFAKPAVILAGGVIEELLRLYLKHKNIAAAGNTFNEYIKACEQNKLLQTGIGKLSDSAREFRNFVHLSKESIKKHSITKAAAKGAVSSIFTIANDL